MASSHSCIADFETLNKLGSGSFGTVYRVRRIIDNAIYVIKNVNIGDLPYREQEEAINEVNLLAGIDSPYIVGYFDSFIEAGSLHIVMEYCNHGDLQTVIKKGKAKDIACLKEDVTWNLGLQVILGLHYLHEKHILHRDLKSANVFLQKDATQKYFSVKIGDLGVAKLLESTTAFAKTIVGTPYYLSPELVKDEPYRDTSDCWALGVLLYECCTLCHPFEARNQCALIMKIIQSPVKPPPETSVSPQLCKLILWLLQKDPTKRPRIRDILCDEYVQQKLKDHHFDLPLELRNEATSYFLKSSEPIVSDARYRGAGSDFKGDSHNNSNNNSDGVSRYKQGTNPDDATVRVGAAVSTTADAKESSVGSSFRHQSINGAGSTAKREWDSIVKSKTGIVAGIGASVSAGAGGVADGQWSCRACTSVNSVLLPYCETCDTPREKDIVVASSSGSGSGNGSDGNNTSGTRRAATGGPPIKPVRPAPHPGSACHTVGHQQVRGDRVRGGLNAKRVTSNKVLTRHQVVPMQVPLNRSKSTPIPTAITPTDDMPSNYDYMADSKTETGNGNEYSGGFGHKGDVGVDVNVNLNDLNRSFKPGEMAASLAVSALHASRVVQVHPSDAKDAPIVTTVEVSNGVGVGVGLSSGENNRDRDRDRDFRLPSHLSAGPNIMNSTNAPVDDLTNLAQDGDAKTNQSTMNTVNTTLSNARTPNHSGPIATSSVAVASKSTATNVTSNSLAIGVGKGHHEHESADDIVAYESDFEDYDDELNDLYEPPLNENDNDKSEGGYCDDGDADEYGEGEDVPLSEEYLAYFGGLEPGTGIGGPGGAIVSLVSDAQAAEKTHSYGGKGAAPLHDFKASLRASMKAGGEGKDDSVIGAGPGPGSDNYTDDDYMSYDSLDEEDADPDVVRRQIDEMLYWISDTREILTKNLGEDIFQDIYTLCKSNMIGSAEVAPNPDSTYLHDIQKKLQEHLHASLEVVLGTVMQVKALLAWEEELARKNLTQAANFLQEF